MVPARAELQRLGAEADTVRVEIRRRERVQQVEARRAARASMGAGEMPTLEQVMASATPPDDAPFGDLVWLRQSATEVRLGYASASHQEVSFTDGVTTEDAADLGSARRLWRDGWDFGTVAARGVRIYPAGSRAERMVPAEEVHLRLVRAGG